MRTLTNDELKINAETMRHILTLRTLMAAVSAYLVEKSFEHDLSKLDDPELELFTKFTPLLKTMKYNSDEYKDCMQQLKPALDNHYSNNPHHPEHYIDGITGMNLFDLIEMLCDWKAASLRSKDGNLYKSLAINENRFNIPEPLVKILRNTLPVIESFAAKTNISISYPNETNR